MPPTAEPERPENPYAPPTAELSTPAAVEAQTVSFYATDRLPKICLRCGVKRGAKRRPLHLRWIPPVAYLGLPLGVLPYLIIVALMQKTADAQVPLCDPCDAIWSNTSPIRGALIVGGLVLAIVTLAVGTGGAPLAGGVLALVSTIAFVFVWRRFLPPTRLRLRQIDAGGVVHFDGVNSEAAEAIGAMYAEAEEDG